MSPPRRISRARRLLFSLVPLVLVLLLGEAATRLLWNRPGIDELDGTGLAPHPTRIWSLDASEQEQEFAGSFQLDPNGMRRTRRTNAPHLVLTIGDSSVFGHGLTDEQTLHESLSRSLGMRGIHADVLTAAVPGYTTEQSLRQLEEVGWNLKPNLLILGSLWSDNDIEPISDSEWMEEMRSPRQLLEWAFRDSRLWEWARWQISPPPEVALPVTFGQDPQATGNRRVPLADYAENLDTILRRAADRGVGALFLAPCNRARASGKEIEGGWPWDRYFEALDQLAEVRSIPLLQGCEVAVSAGLVGEQGFLDEMHPTAPLNAAYADALTALLIENGWPENRLIPDLTAPPLDPHAFSDR